MLYLKLLHRAVDRCCTCAGDVLGCNRGYICVCERHQDGYRELIRSNTRIPREIYKYLYIYKERERDLCDREPSVHANILKRGCKPVCVVADERISKSIAVNLRLIVHDTPSEEVSGFLLARIGAINRAR